MSRLSMRWVVASAVGMIASSALAQTPGWEDSPTAGDAKAASIYGQAFTQNAEFYAFYRSLEAYRSSFRSKSDLLVLEPNSDFFKYLKSAGRGGK